MAKRIMESIIVYCIKTQNGDLKGDKVFLDRDLAEHVKNNYTYYQDCDVYVDSITVPFVGKYLSYVYIYKGFDYGIGNMYDVYYKSELYPSMDMAKKNNKWQQIERQFATNPKEFNIYKNRICSKDIFDHDWCYGDVMEDKVYAEIRKIRVVR